MLEKTDKRIFISLLLIVTLSSVFSYTNDNMSILVITLIFIIIGMIFLYIMNEKGNIKSAICIFLLFFLLYLIHAFIVHYGVSEVYGTPYIKSDEDFFYHSANDVALKLKLGYTFFELDKVYREGTAAYYFFGLVAKIANIFGENSILVIKISIVFIAALIPSFVYSISKLYLSQKQSVVVAIIYGIFSFVPFLSSVLLRDIHVALMFIITIYIILQRLSIVNLIVLVFVSFASYYFRPQTGLFMMGFTVTYFFVFIRSFVKNKYMELAIYSFIISILVVLVLNSNLVKQYEMTANSKGNQTTKEKATGMGAKIAKLPVPLNVVAAFGYGQMQPFPPSWLFTGNRKGIFQISYLISGIAWFIGWGFLLYGLFKKNVLAKVDLKLKLIFFISMLYLILIATIVTGVRRQMAVYPVLYLFMVFSYLEMTVTERTKIWVGMSFFYIILVLILNYLKL